MNEQISRQTETTVHETTLTNLEQEIIRTIAYFDVFAYPLTTDQVYYFLSRNSVTPSHIKETAEELTARGLLHQHCEYFFFPNRSPSLVTSRKDNERRAIVMMKRARRMAALLKCFPFVRAIFLTGSLSKNVASRSSDVDFMIVTAPGRLWICKMLMTAFRRIFLLNSIKYFCVNLFVTENGLRFSEQNIFNAIEIATTRVLWNEAIFQHYRSENSWIKKFLPNWGTDETNISPLSAQPSFIQQAIEFLLEFFPLKNFDSYLMETARRFWKKRYSSFDENAFKRHYQCTSDISTVWHNDNKKNILEGYHQRLKQFNIEPSA
ncbi:MAG: nucleotidyltransferase domain-containing protein [Bacteroidota bacterium]|nr:nucleotidyltransferase domain-containing protein [Bacteroidota bacterium]